jgi:hypothetical protein
VDDINTIFPFDHGKVTKFSNLPKIFMAAYSPTVHPGKITAKRTPRIRAKMWGLLNAEM